ncbi:unnamed protein product [Fraxinus pennsylvanica]|uniref:Uncharacterized protein n=1 Tax=Fraxinus pennsylvanica TaxID=56036 RepID=A0AAD2A956_9LAMI|nr:unnamed protein product [Fraxinus pennsylvanica]
MTALSNSRGFVISPILPSSTSFVTTATMASDQSTAKTVNSVPNSSMKLLFVEMGVGYDQHGQDITSAAMRACRDAISSNSIPAFRRGSIPGVSFDEMKLQIKLGVPQPLQHLLDIEKVKSVFPYGAISNVEVVDGGLICSSGVHNKKRTIVLQIVYESSISLISRMAIFFGNRTRDQYRDSLKIRRGNEELDTQWPRNKLHPLAMQVVHSHCKVTRPLRRKRVLHYKALYSKTIV